MLVYFHLAYLKPYTSRIDHFIITIAIERCPKFLNLNYSEITFLLARSFFVDLCMAVFSLLARVRVLIQQVKVIIYKHG